MNAWTSSATELALASSAGSAPSTHRRWTLRARSPWAYVLDRDGVVAWAEAGGSGGLAEIEEQVVSILGAERNIRTCAKTKLKMPPSNQETLSPLLVPLLATLLMAVPGAAFACGGACPTDGAGTAAAAALAAGAAFLASKLGFSR